MSRWIGKSVLVTGAANGIGKEITRGYANLGAEVYMIDVDVTSGRRLEAELEAEGLMCCFIEGDVGKEEDVLRVLKKVEDNSGELECIINNAGVSRFKPLEDISFNEWENIIHTNLSSVFLFGKYGSKLMEEGGAIVNIASTRAFMSEKNSEAYAASKGGIVALTHALAASLAKKKIRVNAISPGWIETGNYEALRAVDHEQHFSQRVGKPVDIFKTCLYLTDPDNNFVNAENIVIDGGMTRKMMYEE